MIGRKEDARMGGREDAGKDDRMMGWWDDERDGARSDERTNVTGVRPESCGDAASPPESFV